MMIRQLTQQDLVSKEEFLRTFYRFATVCIEYDIMSFILNSQMVHYFSARKTEVRLIFLSNTCRNERGKCCVIFDSDCRTTNTTVWQWIHFLSLFDVISLGVTLFFLFSAFFLIKNNY